MTGRRAIDRALKAGGILIGILAVMLAAVVMFRAADLSRRNSIAAQVSQSPIVRGGKILPNTPADGSNDSKLPPAERKKTVQARAMMRRLFRERLRGVSVDSLPGGVWAANVDVYSIPEPEQNYEFAKSAYNTLIHANLGIRQVTLNAYERQEPNVPDLMVDSETLDTHSKPIILKRYFADG